MRTKLFGAFIAALAITAFAALPSMASAANVTLRDNGNPVAVNETIRATSTSTSTIPAKFTGRPSGRAVECAKTSIRGKVRTNPGTTGARITLRNEGVFEGAGGGDRCAVTNTGGRVKARVENLTFRTDLTLQKENGIVTARTEARFTFRFFDRALEPNGPIAVCNYEGAIELEGTAGTDEFHAESETDATLESGLGNCDSEGFFEGDFRLTRRDGTTPVIMS
jgi:hypothetical protein